MEEKVEDPAPELTFHPPKLWGLEYHFRTFKKMYIRDILNMEEYPMFPGAFAYKNHPVYKVDILGLVVKRDVKNKCYICAIDDGTGVISCCCWKVPYSKCKLGDEQRLDKGFPDILRQKMRSVLGGDEAVEDGSRCQLGDLLCVRGILKHYRGQMEVVASEYHLVTDPNAEVAWMSELPVLYEMAYNSPFQLPWRVQRDVTANMSGVRTQQQQMEQLCKAIRDLLQEVAMTTIYPNKLLQYPSITTLLPQDQERGRARVEGTTLLGEALGSLEQTWGGVGRLVDPQHRPHTFEILCRKNCLHDVVMQILQQQCRRAKFAETGCHQLRVLDELHATAQYCRLHQRALLFVLDCLESDSLVIRTTDKHYMPVV